MEPQLHSAVEPLAFLLGTWQGSGSGDYPTIEPFPYTEELTFSHVGKPFLAYSQKTRHGETGLPSHAEVGYLRPSGGSGVELVLAQPSGVAELLEGTIDGTELTLRSVQVACTATAKEVTATIRRLRLVGDELHNELDMAAVGQDMTAHVAAVLVRQR